MGAFGGGAQGPPYGRVLGQKLYRGEEYYMQVRVSVSLYRVPPLQQRWCGVAVLHTCVCALHHFCRDLDARGGWPPPHARVLLSLRRR